MSTSHPLSIDQMIDVFRDVARDFMGRDGLRQQRVLDLADELSDAIDREIADARGELSTETVDNPVESSTKATSTVHVRDIGGLDEMKPFVDAWIRQRGTSMDGQSYVAALQLAAFVKAALSANTEAAAGELVAPTGMEKAFSSAAMGRRDEVAMADRHAETPLLLELLGTPLIDAIALYDVRIRLEKALASVATAPPAASGQKLTDEQKPARYFLYDPEDGYSEFKTDEERHKAHQVAIDGYLDDGWSEEVTQVVSGIVTHKTVQTSLEHRPAPCAQHPEHDDDDCDACIAWGEWPDHAYDTCCRYEPAPLRASSATASDKEREKS